MASNSSNFAQLWVSPTALITEAVTHAIPTRAVGALPPLIQQILEKKEPF